MFIDGHILPVFSRGEGAKEVSRVSFFSGRRGSLRNEDQLFGLCSFHEKWDFLSGLASRVLQNLPCPRPCLP